MSKNINLAGVIFVPFFIAPFKMDSIIPFLMVMSNIDQLFKVHHQHTMEITVVLTNFYSITIHPIHTCDIQPLMEIIGKQMDNQFFSFLVQVSLLQKA